MKIYDISQEIFSCKIYPGDPGPKREVLSAIADGALYNLTAFSMCAHNGTHIDAPSHFLADGASITEIPLEKTVGFAYVTSSAGALTAADATAILAAASASGADAHDRILLKGDALVTEDAARVFAAAGIALLGVESQSVGPISAPMAVHRILLAAGVLLLEGLRLAHVPDGAYFLSAAPLALGESDGAPTRAILLSE